MAADTLLTIRLVTRLSSTIVTTYGARVRQVA